MTNFEELRKVLMTANEAVKEMEKETVSMQKQINAINDEKFKEIINYFENLVNTCKSCDIGTGEVYFAIPGTRYVTHCYVNSDGTIELGIFRNTHCNEKGIPLNDDFVRWVYLYGTYDRAIRECSDSSMKELIKYMHSNWEEIEPGITNGFKNSITRCMAEKIKKAEQKAVATKATLINTIMNN